MFLRCVLCEYIGWLTTEGLGDPFEAVLRALEIAAETCPECGGSRRAHRQPATNWIYLRCTGASCNNIEWADGGSRERPIGPILAGG